MPLFRLNGEGRALCVLIDGADINDAPDENDGGQYAA